MKETRTDYNRGDLLPMLAIFPQVYALKQWTGPWRLFGLVQDWPAIVGAEVARLTTPAFFRRDVLWIYVQDSAWMHHLQFVKADLITRINQHLQDRPISDLRWQLQPAQPVPPQSVASPSCLVIDRDREQDFQQLSASITNPECREALRHLWRCFAARTK
jgi:hypothetical protein